MSAINVLNTCLDKGLTIAFAESMTGGGACFEMVKHPGASKVVLGSMVVYQEHLKSEWLGVDNQLILEHGVVSLEVAQMMARKIAEKTNASVGIGITGNAGPTRQDDLRGLICFVSIYKQGHSTDLELIFENLSREEAITSTIEALYQKLDEMLS